jgi:hypothetical protein
MAPLASVWASLFQVSDRQRAPSSCKLQKLMQSTAKPEPDDREEDPQVGDEDTHNFNPKSSVDSSTKITSLIPAAISFRSIARRAPAIVAQDSSASDSGGGRILRSRTQSRVAWVAEVGPWARNIQRTGHLSPPLRAQPSPVLSLLLGGDDIHSLLFTKWMTRWALRFFRSRRREHRHGRRHPNVGRHLEKLNAHTNPFDRAQQ